MNAGAKPYLTVKLQKGQEPMAGIREVLTVLEAGRPAAAEGCRSKTEGRPEGSQGAGRPCGPAPRRTFRGKWGQPGRCCRPKPIAEPENVGYNRGRNL